MPTAPRQQSLDVCFVGTVQPWDAEGPPDDPSELSWLGVEYVFQTTEPGDWAVQLVQKVVAFDVLLAHDRYEGRGPLSPGDRLPNRGSIVPGRDSKLECILIAQPKDLPQTFHLESGEVFFQQLVGITSDEAEYSRSNGLEPLLEILEKAHAFPVTDPSRASVL